VVAQFHQAFLRTPLKGYAGLYLLKIYYIALSRSNGGIIFVADDEEHVVGYICGLWDDRSVRQYLIKNYWLSLMWFGGVSLLTQKGMFNNLVNRLISREHKDNIKELKSGYELRPIVVHPDVRGSGVAAQLFDQLREDALVRGYKTIFLYTEEDNYAAQKFYLKQGFKTIKNELHDNQMTFKMEMQVGSR
jgi:ribosomal protein S18 acetylase RimI-like enzyme